MALSQKCQYAVRAVFELAKREHEGPVRVSDIAEAQAIPLRFLHGILNALRGSGIVDSTRGKNGGYALRKSSETLTVGDVVTFFEGSLAPVNCGQGGSDTCPMHNACVFMPLWQRAQQALEEVYYGATFRELLELERGMVHERGQSAHDFVI